MSGLEVESLVGGYGELIVLREVAVQARPGEVTLLAGPNGAGKSTLLAHIVGMLRPLSGRIKLNDVDITTMSTRDRVRHHLSLVPEGRGLFPSLTVHDNLRVAGTALGLGDHRTRAAIAAAGEMFPIIAERMSQRVAQLSGGEQQMLAIARALMCDPTVLLLDEPSMGLAPIVWREVLTLCRRLADAGKVVLLVEQRVLDAIAVADHCVVLQQGRVVRDGLAAELADDPAVFHDYITSGSSG